MGCCADYNGLTYGNECVGVGRAQDDTLYAIPLGVYVDKRVAVNVDYGEKGIVRWTPGAVAVQALTAYVEALTDACNVCNFWQAVRVGEGT